MEIKEFEDTLIALQSQNRHEEACRFMAEQKNLTEQYNAILNGEAETPLAGEDYEAIERLGQRVKEIACIA